MKHIFSKFRSDAGASMIIALVFMLVCVFVGGSVLVAATVNGNRIKDDRLTQQGILDQRSACSVFAKILTGADGKIDISLPYTDNAGSKSANNPYSSTDQALKYTICKVTGDSLADGNKKKSVSFTIEDPDGNTLNCVAVCESDYTVYIGFADNPQVQLMLQGRDNDNTISWYSGKIVKAGQ